MTPLNTKIMRDLWRIKGQAIAIALVIGAGIAMYIMSLGTLYSLEETRSAYYERYRFADIFVPLKRAPLKLKSDMATIPGVKTVEARITKLVTLDLPGFEEPATGQLISLPESGEQVLNVLHLRQGRFLEANRPDEVLVSEAFALAHDFKPGNTFSAIINERKRTLTIVGTVLSPEYIYVLGPGALMPDNKRFGVIWMSNRAMEAAFDLGGSFNEATVIVERGANIAEIITALDSIAEPFGGISAYGRKDQISNWFVTNEISQLQTMGNVAPPLFLGIAALLLHIVVSRLIVTEREQIGLLKAFGYSNHQVAWLYIKFVLAIVLIGLLIGVAAGTWLGRGMTELYTEYFRFPFLYYIFDGMIYVTALVFSVVVGLFGTLTSVWRAVRLMPAVAMQPPPPTSYQTAWVERLLQLKGMSESSRMILRHALRWPARTSLSVFGSALAVSILVSSIFFLDSMDQLVDLQFFQTQRQNVTVRFTETQSDATIREIAKIPGVLATEPIRSVPVRLINGHRKRFENIVGLSSDATIYRPLNTNLRPLRLPDFGLALSTKMASILDVSLGDTITVEIKEGRRHVFELPITVLVEEYIGSPVYMEIKALNQLLAEDPTVTGATLRIDKLKTVEILRRLKGFPSISAVSLQDVLVKSFRKTIEENMGLMIVFNIIFAGIIAFGVVYNSARISLSERSRELASLRVLGFMRGEVAYILLGEQLLLIAIALPIGCLIGYGQSALWVLSMDSDLFRLPFVIARDTYAWSVVIVLIAATISGLIVRRKLDSLGLVEALKTRE